MTAESPRHDIEMLKQRVEKAGWQHSPACSQDVVYVNDVIDWLDELAASSGVSAARQRAATCEVHGRACPGRLDDVACGADGKPLTNRELMERQQALTDALQQLRSYVQHKADCQSVECENCRFPRVAHRGLHAEKVCAVFQPYKCTCGLDDVLKAINQQEKT